MTRLNMGKHDSDNILGKLGAALQPLEVTIPPIVHNRLKHGRGYVFRFLGYDLGVKKIPLIGLQEIRQASPSSGRNRIACYQNPSGIFRTLGGRVYVAGSLPLDRHKRAGRSHRHANPI